MNTITRGRQLCVLTSVLFAFALSLVGCGGDFSPASPANPQPGTGVANVGQAVVQGQAVTGGGAGNAVSTAAVGAPAVTVANLKVTVEGTGISDLLDANGRFRLVNVPGGNVKLRFTGTGVDAQLALQGIALKQHLNITVQVQSASTQLLSEQRSDLPEFDSTVVSVIRLDKSTSITLSASAMSRIPPGFTDLSGRWRTPMAML